MGNERSGPAYWSRLLTHKLFSQEVSFSLWMHYIRWFSAPKLHTHAHAVIFYTFVTLTTPNHQRACNSHSSRLTISRLDWEKSFTARNGGPTRREDCYLSPFVQRRREMAWPTQLQPRAFQGQAQKQPCYLGQVLKPAHLPLSCPFCWHRT